MLETDHSKRHGVLFAVAAYCIWGVFPLYFKLLGHLSPVMVVSWRCIWSFATMALILTILSRWDRFFDCFRSWRRFGILTLSMIMITSNWGVFIYAVSSGQVLQSSLAYFINPLVSVLLGVVFLKERLRQMQIISIALATVGVLIMTFLADGFPSLALILAFSFGAYGYLRKTVQGVDGLTGLSVETGIATPLAILLLLWLQQSGHVVDLPAASSTAASLAGYDHAMLVLLGTITVAPLIFFVTAARRLPLSTVGMLQYITPTLHFLLAIFAFGESFSVHQFISFGFIWLAVSLFLIDSHRTRLTPPI